MLRRLLICSLAMVLALSPALAQGVQFRITADIDPVQYDSDLQSLMAGLAALADVGAIEGTLLPGENSFDMNAALLLPHRDETCRTDLHVWGLDSHWGIASSLLGETELMVNNLALAEFGVKAYNHLGVPLQYAALAVPYTHTSALDVLRPVVTPLFPEEDGETLLTAEDLRALTGRIAELARTDRTVRCWIEAVGIASGGDQVIFDTLDALPETMGKLCPQGMAVIRSGDDLHWQPVGSDAALLSLTHEGSTAHLTASLPGVIVLETTLRDDGSIQTGTLRLESAVLDAEIGFSLPTALPVTLPFFLTVDAEGMLLGEMPVKLVFEGEAHGSTLTIRQLLPDQTRTMMTLTAVLTPIAGQAAAYTSADLAGVNILSVTGATLGELMREVAPTLVKGLFDLVAAMPASTCQALMDLLDVSGILPLLTDAMSGSDESY